MTLYDSGNDWQDAYIAELVALLDTIRSVVDEHPEVWEPLERAGISLRAPAR